MSRIVPSIPLQPQVTVSESYQGQAFSIPQDLMAALDAWSHIVDEEEANKAALAIQERINQSCHPTP